MFLCTVKGKITSTAKCENMTGLSFVIVQKVQKDNKGKILKTGDSFVVVDCIGCGVGNLVLVVLGTNAKYAVNHLNHESLPIDAAILGIVDEDNFNF